jgi:purine-binding chemotaxis protein CheW
MLEPQLAGQYLPLGIVVDGVATLLDLEVAQVKPAPRFGAGIDVRCLEGLVPTEHGTLPLIDFARIFATDELAELAERTSSDLDSTIDGAKVRLDHVTDANE